MPIVPYGTTNLSAQGIPNVTVQVLPPQPIITGVDTGLIASVGTANYGPVNSPTLIYGGMNEYVPMFGNPSSDTYDMGTTVYAANQQGASRFLCVRVTDGTDVASSLTLLDTTTPTALPGARLTSKYTGTLGNTINAVISIGTSYTASVPTYKLSIYRSGGIAEVFDNIGGSGNVFWQNLVSAVNNGQSTNRGPSQIVIASLSNGISAVTITNPGSYTTLPTLTASIGSGAVLAPKMYLVSSTLNAGGTGYAVDDKLTLIGGTFSTPVGINVDTVSGGAIVTYSIDDPGVYTALPTNPVAQGSTSGSGTGATFNVNWGILSASVTASGTGYNSSSVLNISGSGGGAGTLSVGATTAPAQQTYTASGGTSGNTGVTDSTLIGTDVIPRKGMYALRGKKVPIIVLSNQTNPTYWPTQLTYSLSEGLPYMINTIAAGYQDNISGATLILQNTGIDSPYFRLVTGDWTQLFNQFTNQTLFISPQGTLAGKLATILPSDSALNKPLQAILATQKSAEDRVYSDGELLQLKTGRLDVITKGIPASDTQFGSRLGINTSSNPLTNQDNYPRMIYFLGQTIEKALGLYIGDPHSADLEFQAKSTLVSFLNQLWKPKNSPALIGYATDANKVPYQVTISATNNTQNTIALGFLIANVTVVLFTITQQIIVNLDANQNATIQAFTPIPV